MLTRRHMLGLLSSAWVGACARATIKQRPEPRQERVFTPKVNPGARRDQSGVIQSAIDLCALSGGGTVLLPAGTFLVSAHQFQTQDGAVGGAFALTLRSGVSLRGAGAATVLRVLPRSYGPGALFAVIGSNPEEPIRVSRVQNLTIDGARDFQIANNQANNITLTCAADVAVEDVVSLNANGTSIMLRGLLNHPARGIRIKNCTVRSATNIGIQASQFEDGQITGNNVESVENNGIDIYGEDGSTTSATANFLIANNYVSNGLVGIFIETSRDGKIRNNVVRSSRLAGLAVNRINGEPRNVLFVENTVEAPTGIRVTGDTGGIRIQSNTFAAFTESAIQLGDAAGNVSHVEILDNHFVAASAAAPLVLLWGKQAAFISGHGNSARSSNSVPVESRASVIVAVELDELLARRP